RQWAALFEDIDVVLAPVFGTAAYPHDDRPSDQRTLILDGQPTPYFAQLAWPGLASLANLPATAAPIGQTKAGLPMACRSSGPISRTARRWPSPSSSSGSSGASGRHTADKVSGG